MNASKLLNTKAGAVAVGLVVLGGFAYLGAKKTRETAGEVGEAINPLNNDNVFASGVDAVGARLSGEANWSLGGWIYDVVNGSPAEQLQRAEEKNLINNIIGG